VALLTCRRAGRRKKCLLLRGPPASANADELLWTYRHIDEDRGASHNGRRSTGWNFTPTKFNFFAGSCPRKRDRASRKDWISPSFRETRLERGGGRKGERRENRIAKRSGVDCAEAARHRVVGKGRRRATNGRGLFSLKERKMRIPCAEAELLNIKVSEFRGASKVHSKT